MVISPIMGKKKKKGKNIWAAWNRTSTATFLAKNILSLSVPFCSDLTHFLSPRFINQSQKKTTVLVECQFSNLRLLSQYGEFWSGRWRDFQERKEKGHTREGHTKESFDNRAFPERLQNFWQFHRYFFASTNDIIVEITKKTGCCSLHLGSHIVGWASIDFSIFTRKLCHNYF